MTPQEVSKWMREEHQLVDKLARELHDQVAIIPRTNVKAWIQDARETLAKFEESLSSHFNFEEDGGYLQAVVDHQPTLVPEVARLRHEHDELARILASIQRDLSALNETDFLLIEDCGIRLQSAIRYIKEHEDRENLMVISVFTNDLGTKD